MVVLLCVMSLLIFVQVIMRYIFNNSLSWSEELARYLFIWMVYLAIGYAAKQRKHIKIDAALWLFPQRIRPYICIVGDIVVLLFSAFIIKTSYELFMKIAMLGQKSAAMGIPMPVSYTHLDVYKRQGQSKVRIFSLPNGRQAVCQAGRRRKNHQSRFHAVLSGRNQYSRLHRQQVRGNGDDPPDGQRMGQSGDQCKRHCSRMD